MKMTRNSIATYDEALISATHEEAMRKRAFVQHNMRSTVEPVGLSAFMASVVYPDSHPGPAPGPSKRTSFALPTVSPRSSATGVQPGSQSSSSARAREDMRRRLHYRANRARLALVLERWLEENRLRVDPLQLIEALRAMDLEPHEDHVDELFRAFDADATTGRVEVRTLHEALWWGKRDPRGAAAMRLLTGAKLRDAAQASRRSSSDPSAPAKAPSSLAARLHAVHAFQTAAPAADSPGRSRPSPPTVARKLTSHDLRAYRLDAAAAVGGEASEDASTTAAVAEKAAAERERRRVEQLGEECARSGLRIIEHLMGRGMSGQSEVTLADLQGALQAHQQVESGAHPR